VIFSSDHPSLDAGKMYLSQKRLSASVFRVKIVALGPLKMVSEKCTKETCENYRRTTTYGDLFL
jgi:hypothetical protein